MHAILTVLLTLAPLGMGLPGGADGLPDHVPYPGGYFGQGQTTVVAVETFRFCARECHPDSVAYVRTPAGPVPGTDNPRAVVYMQKGAHLTWVYRDHGCDLLRCAGHDIRVEDGTGDGRQIGVVSADTDNEALSWTIPPDAEPETMIRYFCARHANLGMTGAFQVLPIAALTVPPPPGW